MVVLPAQFVATKFPGYFWNTKEKKLYSIKVTGELRPMKFHRGGRFYGYVVKPGYQVSHQGKKRTMTEEYLLTLKETSAHQVIGIQQSLF